MTSDRPFRCGALIPTQTGKRVLIVYPYGVLYVFENGMEIHIKPHILSWIFYPMNFARPVKKGSPSIAIAPNEIALIEMSEDSLRFHLADGRDISCRVLPEDATPAVARFAQRNGLRVMPTEKVSRPSLWGGRKDRSN